MAATKPPSPSIDTPCLVINDTVMRRNITTMARTAHNLGVRLRPHVKTHKTPSIAALQLAAGAHGVTVAKVSEAEVMVKAGITNVFIAYPLVTVAKVHRAFDLLAHGKLCLGVDSIAGARLISKHAVARHTTVDIRLEIDTGYQRTGIPAERAAHMARSLSRLPGIALSGVFTFREATLSDGTSTTDAAKAGREEGRLMSEIARTVRQAGIPITDVSVGSTPTAAHAATADGVTEIRPGTYVFHDRMQRALGACRDEDIAATIRTTVVSRPRRHLAVVDAGSKAISVDVRPNEPPLHLRGYGEVAGAPEIVLHRLSEEHGMLHLPDHYELQIGDQVDLVPNHICTTVALHDYVAIIADDDPTIRFEKVSARGKLT